MDNLILALAEKGILVSISEGKLVVNAPQGVLDDGLINSIKDNKEALIKYVAGHHPDTGDRFKNIEPVKEQLHYMLSSSQRRLWILSHFKEGNLAYNMPGAFIFDGDLDVISFEHAVNSLIERHESLRTIFKTDEYGDARQFIQQPGESGFRMSGRDISSTEEQENLLDEIINAEYATPFDLAAGPLIRASLYKLKENKWLFTYTLHHIISDGWSMEVLIHELLLLYNAYKKGEANPLLPLQIQYKDYAAWQQEQLKHKKLAEHKAWWLEQFSGELPVLDLPGDKLRPVIKSYNGAVECRTINKNLADGLRAIGQKENASFFMSLMALTYTLLHRYTNQEDIIIGSAAAGREHNDLENQIGFYLDTVPLRIRFEGSNSFRELLRLIKQLNLEANEHQLYPYDELVNDLGIKPDAGRNPLFDVMLELRDQYRTTIMAPAVLSDIRVSAFEGKKPLRSKFDITFFFTESGEGLNLLMEYNSDIINQEMAEQIGVHVEQMISSITDNPDLSINKLEYVSAAELQKLLFEFNNTQVIFPEHESILSLFGQMVQNTPGAVALEFENTTVTYKVLDEKSNQLAHYLTEICNVQPGNLVGIMLDRSEKMIISILGIMKSGAAYVPIEPDYPPGRKKYILEDTGLEVLITQSNYIFDIPDYRGVVFTADIQWDALEASKDPILIKIQPGTPAYVIYTSGSTGEPKGCVVSRGNLFNYIKWANDYYFKNKAKANCGLYTSLSFDLTVTSIFCPLTQGGKLYIYNQHRDPAEIFLHSFSTASGINTIKLTPSHINLLEHLPLQSTSLLFAIVGGEEVTQRHISILKHINPSIAVYNEYGPTETTVGCIVALLEENTAVLIGKPVYNTSIYILDAEGAICPAGVTGEIHISGDSVASGYLNKSDLTGEKFVADPYVTGKTMYRSGDTGYWLADGNLVFAGRKDEQIKIRGHRVETGEVAGVLKKHHAIKEVVVLAKPDKDGNNSLVACFVTKDEFDPAFLQDKLMITDSIHDFLKEQLPAYMIPQQFIQLRTIPLTQNGKVDKMMLLRMEAVQDIQRTAVYIAPRDPIEEKLVLIWQEILGKEKIGVKDSFFDLGGHSLIATRLIARISKEFDMNYSFDSLFSQPTIEFMAEEIEKTNWVNKNIMGTEKISNTEKFLI